MMNTIRSPQVKPPAMVSQTSSVQSKQPQKCRAIVGMGRGVTSAAVGINVGVGGIVVIVGTGVVGIKVGGVVTNRMVGKGVAKVGATVGIFVVGS